jgi:hypothetical protein
VVRADPLESQYGAAAGFGVRSPHGGYEVRRGGARGRPYIAEGVDYRVDSAAIGAVETSDQGLDGLHRREGAQ